MTTTDYIWDVRNDTYLMEQDGGGATTAVYSNEPHTFGEIVSQTRGGSSRYYHFDGRASTRALTDQNENATDTATYAAYGDTVASTGATTPPFGYKGALGYYMNSDDDSIYVRARAFQPSRARWISADPLGFHDGSNRYSYVANRPTVRSDPSGQVGLVLNPRAAAGMPWYDVEDTREYGTLGETRYVIDVQCTCHCASVWIRRRFRRFCCSWVQMQCEVTGSFYIRIARDYIRCINDPLDSTCEEERRELERLGVPYPSLATTYGHEQLHVANWLTFLRQLARRLAAKEARRFGSIEACEQLANAAEADAATDLNAFAEEEAAHQHVPPARGLGYPPTGQMPTDPSSTPDGGLPDNSLPPLPPDPNAPPRPSPLPPFPTDPNTPAPTRPPWPPPVPPPVPQ